MNNRQQQIQRQQQSLLPQQIMMIKLLEIPAIEMEERIRKEIEENPALEEGVPLSENIGEMDDNQDFKEENADMGADSDSDSYDDSYEDYDDDDDIPDYKLAVNNYSPDNVITEIPVQNEVSFHEFLTDQISLAELSDKDLRIADYIIGNINEEGYLQRTAEDIADDILFQTGEDISVSKICEIIELIKTLEPAGVGAADLQECLLLQLKRKKPTDAIKLSMSILSDYFDDFSKRQYKKILAGIGISEMLLESAVSEIKKLNPKPGNAWSSSAMERNSGYIVPDFILENHDGELSLSLNEKNMPSLRVTPEYTDMFASYSSQGIKNKEIKKAADFIRQKIDSANTFIEAIRQRQITLLATMNAIVKRQREYFLTGDENFLKPMIMKDIAQDTGYDISTVSRVSNSKYIQTDFGFFSLKHFFNEKATTENGDEISARKIKRILAEQIEIEDKKKPFSDDELSKILKQQGFVVARRTVARYRELMEIPTARLRKEI